MTKLWRDCNLTLNVLNKRAALVYFGSDPIAPHGGWCCATVGDAWDADNVHHVVLWSYDYDFRDIPVCMALNKYAWEHKITIDTERYQY